MVDDRQRQFPPQLVAGQDAKIAADIGDDGSDRAAADVRRDLLRRGEQRETRVGILEASGGRSGGARLALRRGAGAAGFFSSGTGRRMSRSSSAPARRRPRVMRARISAKLRVPNGRVMAETETSLGAARRCNVQASSKP